MTPLSLATGASCMVGSTLAERRTNRKPARRCTLATDDQRRGNSSRAWNKRSTAVTNTSCIYMPKAEMEKDEDERPARRRQKCCSVSRVLNVFFALRRLCLDW